MFTGRRQLKKRIEETSKFFELPQFAGLWCRLALGLFTARAIPAWRVTHGNSRAVTGIYEALVGTRLSGPVFYMTLNAAGRYTERPAVRPRAIFAAVAPL